MRRWLVASVWVVCSFTFLDAQFIGYVQNNTEQTLKLCCDHALGKSNSKTDTAVLDPKEIKRVIWKMSETAKIIIFDTNGWIPGEITQESGSLCFKRGLAPEVAIGRSGKNNNVLIVTQEDGQLCVTLGDKEKSPPQSPRPEVLARLAQKYPLDPSQSPLVRRRREPGDGARQLLDSDD